MWQSDCATALIKYHVPHNRLARFLQEDNFCWCFAVLAFLHVIPGFRVQVSSTYSGFLPWYPTEHILPLVLGSWLGLGNEAVGDVDLAEGGHSRIAVI